MTTLIILSIVADLVTWWLLIWLYYRLRAMIAREEWKPGRTITATESVLRHSDPWQPPTDPDGVL